MRWFSVRISGALFLILQAGLFQIIWAPQTEAVEIYLAYSILTFLVALAAIGFLFLQRAGWLLAMMTQGLSLLVSLFVYFFGSETILAQITMAYSIFMVLYLNLFVIRGAFRSDLDDQNIAGELP